MAERSKRHNEFTRRLQEIEKTCAAFYAKFGGSDENGDGAFQTRIDDVRLRFRQARETAINLKQMDADGYMAELELIAKDIAAADGTMTLAELQTEQAVNRYDKALAKLKDAAATLIDVDSDKAIELGLTVKPAEFEKQGSALVVQKGPKKTP